MGIENLSNNTSEIILDQGMPFSDKDFRILRSNEMLKSLSNVSCLDTRFGYIDGTETRILRLLRKIDTELNPENSVSLITRYFWESIVEKELDNEKHDPPALEMDLTTFCSSKCFFCKEGKEKKRKQLNWEMLEKSLYEFSRNKTTSLIIYSGGGEPTDSTMFTQAIELTHELGFRQYVSTYGGKIGTKRIPISSIVENIDVIKFSVGAPTNATYNFIHNEGLDIKAGNPKSVDDIFGRIADVCANRRVEIVQGSPIKLPFVWVAMTISPINENEVLNMTERVLQSGADTLLLRPVMSRERTLTELDEGIRQMNEAQNCYGKKLEILTFRHKLDHVKGEEDRFNHCLPIPVVSADSIFGGDGGSVTPCVFRRGNRPGNGWLVGGEPNFNNLREIVESERYQQVVENQDKRLYQSEYACPGCRRVLTNVYLDILKRASKEERDIIRKAVLERYPETQKGEIIKGFI